jgi:hypothetical protein
MKGHMEKKDLQGKAICDLGRFHESTVSLLAKGLLPDPKKRKGSNFKFFV